jgi:serine/threonine-protein kinase ULK/ATG1
MEYCELGDLSYFIKRRDRLADNPALRDMARKYPVPSHGGLNEVVVRHFLKQLASAMEFLRDRNFIHRDVKPQNLLLLPSPEYIAKTKDQPLVMTASQEPLVPRVGLRSLPMLKIADFGFARSLPSTSLAETLCGSPLYMAPEILRYEKYDAKADLWSVGTVLFEMMVGRPPFRANNHVELLRKIEQSEDQIRFPKEVVVSPSIKDLIKRLLKRTPVERIPFDDFFRNPVVVDPIPGLVGDDIPAEIRISNPRTEDASSVSRHSSINRRHPVASERDTRVTPSPSSSSPRERAIASSPRQQLAEPTHKLSGTPPRHPTQPRPSSRDQKRPTPVAAATTPNPETVQIGRPPSRTFNPTSRNDPRRAPSRQSSADETTKRKSSITDERQAIAEAEQAVRDAREYVLVEKRAVEVNAFADEMAANPRLTGAQQPAPRSGTITRRATTQGAPSSITGAVPTSPSRAIQIAQGRTRPEGGRERKDSYSKSFGSPSTTSAIAKALHGASVRVFGVGWSPHLIGKGISPPQLYSPFPAYPTPHGTIGLIGDGKPVGPIDEDQKAVNVIEESATRSDVVYGFAEVKYKQLIPLAPSMDHGLGGPSADRTGDSVNDDDGLTVEAIVSLSEEALVLYVKALSLLAKSMDIAGAWWVRRRGGEIISSGNTARSDSPSSVAAGNRINSAVQWVRNRFNEVLEKAEFVRLKLVEAQKQLPEDHPGHPSNHASASRIAGGSSTDGVVLSSGITAEKLMYDRALEMSRSAAINEIANEDLPGCEISYITAIRMLEAVLENDDDTAPPSRPRASSLRETRADSDADGAVNGIRLDDRQAVMKGTLPLPTSSSSVQFLTLFLAVVSMVRTRLATLRKKMAIIAKHHSLPPAPSSPRPPSTHSGGATPTITNTPPR